MYNAEIAISKRQQEFLEAKDPLVIFRGGIRSGKTVVACIKAVLNAIAGRKQLFISADYPQSRDVVVPTFHDIMSGFWKDGKYYPGLQLIEGVDYEYNKTDMDIIVRGTYIHLRSAERSDRLRGISASDAFIDEARTIKAGAGLYDIVLGRLSDVSDPQVCITSSPHGKDWVYRLSKEQPCRVIVQATSKNPFLPKGYVAALRARYTAKFASQELDAEIVEFGAGVIKPSLFRVVPWVKPVQGVRYWDFAVSVKTAADYTAGALCLFSGPAFCVAHMIKGKWAWPQLKELIIATAKADGYGVTVGVEQAGQQLALIDDLRQDARLRPYTIKALKPRGDKLARAMPWVSQAELGNMSVMDGPWLQDFADECDSFTGADDATEHDDQVDSVSGGYTVLSHKGTASFTSLPI